MPTASLRRSDTPPRGRQPGNARPASSDTPLTGAEEEQGPSPSTLGLAGLRRPLPCFLGGMLNATQSGFRILGRIVIATLAPSPGRSASAWADLPARDPSPVGSPKLAGSTLQTGRAGPSRGARPYGPTLAPTDLPGEGLCTYCNCATVGPVGIHPTSRGDQNSGNDRPEGGGGLSHLPHGERR